MNLYEFQQIKLQFDEGMVRIINRRSTKAFLHEKKWYPAKLFVAQLHPDINAHESINILTNIFPYLRFEQINFIGSNNLPIPITLSETMNETRLLLEKLNELYLDMNI